MKRVIAVTIAPPYASEASAPALMATKSSVPNTVNSRNIATRRPKSPIRFTMNAFLPASDFSRSPNQKPIRR